MHTQPVQRRLWPRALFWAVVLSVFFMTVYNSTNWVASQRTDVGSLYFSWERHIPFVPAAIVPYMSIDLFFVFSFFLCANTTELRVHVRRIMFAIAAAGILFLLFPLKMASVRPPTEGVYGLLIALLDSFDHPYNLCPSLHITLRSLLWVIYVPHTRGISRRLLQGWFILIGLSTLLTWQHHLIDVVGGQILAIVCFYLFPYPLPQSAASAPTPAARRLGRRYALGAMLCLALASLLRPWGLVLLWPAFALGVVAAGYYRFGPEVFRKTGGRHPLSTRILLAPYFVGLQIAHLFYRRSGDSCTQIIPGLLIGRRPGRNEAHLLRSAGVRAVLDLSGELPETSGLRHMNYHQMPILDLTPPTVKQLQEAAAFIAEHGAHGAIYIHCALGYLRSATVAAAYMLHTGQASTVQSAIQAIRAARPRVVFTRESVDVLRRFRAQRQTMGAGLSPARTAAEFQLVIPAPAAGVGLGRL